MKAVILAGGFGTRIREVSQEIPKPMIQIGPYPILMHIIKHYIKYDVNEFIICLGYKGNYIKDYFLNLKPYSNNFSIDFKNEKTEFFEDHTFNDCKVTFVDTGNNSMTGSRISKISKFINKEEDFCITYGDGVSDVNIKKLIDYHRNKNKILTVTGVRPPGRFGEIDYDKNNIVSSFNEKPQTTEGRISGGFFVADYKLFDYLNEKSDLVFEEEPMKILTQEHQLIMFEHNGFWHPMDTSRDYNYLNDLYESGSAPWL